MNIRIVAMGKTSQSFVRSGIELYLGRLSHYCRIDWVELPDTVSGNSSQEIQRRNEGVAILKNFRDDDFVVLLDDKGEMYSSADWSKWIQKRMNSGLKSLVFVIGGAYGFSEDVRLRSNHMVSLSRMTFPHDLVRLILAEQLYRGFTILRGEHYHHD
jgi:23S rRNA (pseudouridine1915-N3)-methyltransferase